MASSDAQRWLFSWMEGRAGIVLGLALSGALGCGGEASTPCTGTECGTGATGSTLGTGGQAGYDAGSGFGGSFLPDAGPVDSGPPPCEDFDFPFTSTQQVFTAPSTAVWMHVKAWGAGGNQEGTCNGGIGGYSEGIFAVQPHQPLIVIVGGAGSAQYVQTAEFGWGNSGGGGLSGVFTGSDPLTDTSWDRALLIAGGGGGDGVKKGGGPCITAIPGNAANAGGAPTMQGGPGLDSGVNGGGGGYRGGFGGAKGEAGTGGTSFPDAAGTNVPPGLVQSLILAANVGDAVPPNSADPDYDGLAGQTEANGRVVVHFKCDKPVIETPR